MNGLSKLRKERRPCSERWRCNTRAKRRRDETSIGTSDFSLAPARSRTIIASSKASASAATRNPPPHPDPYKTGPKLAKRRKGPVTHERSYIQRGVFGSATDMNNERTQRSANGAFFSELNNERTRGSWAAQKAERTTNERTVERSHRRRRRAALVQIKKNWI